METPWNTLTLQNLRCKMLGARGQAPKFARVMCCLPHLEKTLNSSFIWPSICSADSYKRWHRSACVACVTLAEFFQWIRCIHQPNANPFACLIRKTREMDSHIRMAYTMRGIRMAFGSHCLTHRKALLDLVPVDSHTFTWSFHVLLSYFIAWNYGNL